MAQPATAMGGTTRVRRTSFAVSDPASKKTSLILESVDNDKYFTHRNHSRMMYYLLHLGFFEVPAADLTGVKIDNTYRCNFKM